MAQSRNENPIVAVSITIMALTAMLVLAFNLFVQPDRSTDLNPVGKQGTRTAAPQNSDASAMNNGATSTTHAN